jgi:hypothetical protein
MLKGRSCIHLEKPFEIALNLFLKCFSWRCFACLKSDSHVSVASVPQGKQAEYQNLAKVNPIKFLELPQGYFLQLQEL